MTIYSLDVLFFLFGISLLFHVQFELLLSDLHTDFSRGRLGGLVSPSLRKNPKYIYIYIYLFFGKGRGTREKIYIDIDIDIFGFFFKDMRSLSKLWERTRFETKLPRAAPKTMSAQGPYA